MNRAVGFPAAIAARLLASGQIQGTGLLSPATHVPYEPFVTALAGHGLVWREEETAA